MKVRALVTLLSGFMLLAACERQETSALRTDTPQRSALMRAVEFTLPDLAGRPHALSEYRARGPVMLVFFTTWCPYCRREIPALKNAYRELHPKGLQVVAVNAALADSIENARAYALEHRLPYPVLYDADGAVSAQYGVQSVPRIYLIEEDGDIVGTATHVPQDRLEGLVQGESARPVSGAPARPGGEDNSTPTAVRPDAESRTTGEGASRAALLSSASEAAHGIVVGNPAGDVTLVEFFDYNCDYCRDVAKHVRELLRADPTLRLVLRSFPLRGAESKEAAQVTWAVSRVSGAERAFEFHTRLMGTRGPLDGQRALAIAAEMDFDATRLRQLMNDEVGRQAAEHNLHLAHGLRLTGTPAFVIRDEIVLGAASADHLRGAIANVRACGSTRC